MLIELEKFHIFTNLIVISYHQILPGEILELSPQGLKRLDIVHRPKISRPKIKISLEYEDSDVNQAASLRNTESSLGSPTPCCRSFEVRETTSPAGSLSSFDALGEEAETKTDGCNVIDSSEVESKQLAMSSENDDVKRASQKLERLEVAMSRHVQTSPTSTSSSSSSSRSGSPSPCTALVTPNGSKKRCSEAKKRTAPVAFCIFEYVYFSRPDSIFEGKL